MSGAGSEALSPSQRPETWDERRSKRRSSDMFSPVDLGHEPAIELDGMRHTADDHRRVSLHWLAGTALTGFSGALLIGAAIYAALGHRENLIHRPYFAADTSSKARAGEEIDPNRGDRLVQPVDIIAAKQTFRVPSTMRVGDKEIVTSASYTHVSTPLALSHLGIGDEVPKFDPLNLIANAANPRGSQATSIPNLDDTEVSFRMLDLNAHQDEPLTGELSAQEIESQILEEVKTSLAAGDRTGLALPPQLLLMHTSRAAIDLKLGPDSKAKGPGFTSAPFSDIKVKMVPENLSTFEKSSASPNALPDEIVARTRQGQSLAAVLGEAGVPDTQIGAVTRAFADKDKNLFRGGQQLKLQFSKDGTTEPTRQLVRISDYAEDELLAVFAINDAGVFVPQMTPNAGHDRRKPGADDEDRLPLYNAFYETALQQNLPKKLIQQMVNIFANDIDFLAPVSPGDSFQAFYTNPDLKKNAHELLYASITTHNETHRYFRFRDTGSNIVDYYDSDGHSSRKFLIRKPIDGGHMSSEFGWRYHPILHTRKLHTGVDWAAPIGTPIFAAGNGTIIKAGWSNGYGRRVEIQHAYGYETTYNHMSGFGRGITTGARVRQGQIVGYVGTTGLSTGPHLHYEVKINNEFQDPMRVKLAGTKDLSNTELSAFRSERTRIEKLLAQVPNAGAQVASASKP